MIYNITQYIHIYIYIYIHIVDICSKYPHLIFGKIKPCKNQKSLCYECNRKI